mmetsp:Transcript_14227/g.42392  ORF Transcript_14227/g.42392 Transcript_14227/m.42392 type:complete len:219 (-) Transcript_14227:1049-1705(-)
MRRRAPRRRRNREHWRRGGPRRGGAGAGSPGGQLGTALSALRLAQLPVLLQLELPPPLRLLSLRRADPLLRDIPPLPQALRLEVLRAGQGRVGDLVHRQGLLGGLRLGAPPGGVAQLRGRVAHVARLADGHRPVQEDHVMAVPRVLLCREPGVEDAEDLGHVLGWRVGARRLRHFLYRHRPWGVLRFRQRLLRASLLFLVLDHQLVRDVEELAVGDQI